MEGLRDTVTEQSVDLRTAMRTGIPVQAILTYVDERGIDVLVMGTHGRDGIRRYLLGSTTERVLRKSPVPVLTVRDGTDSG